MKIAFIGGGNMASAMIHGLLSSTQATGANARASARIEATTLVAAAASSASHSMAVVEPYAPAREVLLKQALPSLQVFADSASAAAAGSLDADIVILAVKPQVMPEVAQGLAPYAKQQLFLSVAAGIRMKDLSRWLGGHQRLVRAMPNTPALIGMGIAGVTAFPGVTEAEKALAEALLKSVGEVVWIDDENMIDAVTAVSGSGPAYVFLVLEAMQAAGEKLGLSSEQAAMLAKHTVRGAAELAQRSNEQPSVLRERVTSKGGTTAAALAVMNSHGLVDIFAEALQAAQARGAQMGEEFGRGG
jgi:pyrroline-5-carboxylate reductase